MKKILALLLSLSMAASMAGCGGKNVNESSEVTKTTPDEYPLQTDVQLRAFVTSWSPGVVQNKNDTEFAKYIAEATGIKVSFEHPAPGTLNDAWNLLLASDNMPDIVMNGGIRQDKAQEWLDTGIFEDLGKYIDAGLMPNLKKILDEHPEYVEQMQTADGRFYYAPMILGDEILRSYKTYIVRKDILDKAGLPLPETLEEWEAALAAFKDAGVETPITLDLSIGSVMDNAPFMSCFNLGAGFYQVDGKVKLNIAEPGFKDWLKTMSDWYAKGWLDKEYVDQSTTRINQIMTSGEGGATLANVGGGLGTYLSAISPTSEIKLSPAKVPVAKKGEKAMMHPTQSYVHSAGAAISCDSKHKELAARWLDFGYSEEGQLLYNFGKEGVSYTMEVGEDGVKYPKYTDIITDPKKRGENVSMGQQLAVYADTGNPLSVQNKYYFLQMNNTPEQKLAVEYANDTDYDKYALPVVVLDPETNIEINDKWNPIQTYAGETIAKIITGRVDFEKGVEEYYKEIERMGVQEIINIYQEAYDAKKAE